MKKMFSNANPLSADESAIDVCDVRRTRVFEFGGYADPVTKSGYPGRMRSVRS